MLRTNYNIKICITNLYRSRFKTQDVQSVSCRVACQIHEDVDCILVNHFCHLLGMAGYQYHFFFS